MTRTVQRRRSLLDVVTLISIVDKASPIKTLVEVTVPISLASREGLVQAPNVVSGWLQCCDDLVVVGGCQVLSKQSVVRMCRLTLWLGLEMGETYHLLCLICCVIMDPHLYTTTHPEDLIRT